MVKSNILSAASIATICLILVGCKKMSSSEEGNTDDFTPIKSLTRAIVGEGVFTYVAGTKGKYFLVNRESKKILPGVEFQDYQENCDWPLPVKSSTGMWGYLSRDSKFVIEPQYIAANCFIGQYANVFSRDGHKIIRMDNTIKLNFPMTQLDDIGSLAYGRLTFRVHSTSQAIAGGGYRYGVLDEDGKVFIPPSLEVSTYFSDGLMAVSEFNKPGIGYIDPNGNLVLPQIYQTARPFHQKLARVTMERNGPVGFIDTTGAVRIPFQFQNATDFFEDMAAVQVNGKWGYVSLNGEMLVAPQFEKAGRFRDGLAKVTREGSDSYVDKEGKIIINLAN